MKYNRKISTQIYRALLSRSGNKCAFPGCPCEIINRDHILVAQLCHIEPIAEGEPRWNDKLDDNLVNRYENLMFMCNKHHIITNDEDVYTVSKMKEMKYAHEDNFTSKPFEIDMSYVFEIKHENDQFWKRLDQEIAANPNAKSKVYLINTRAEFDELKLDLVSTLEALEPKVIQVQMNQSGAEWYTRNVEMPNSFNKARALVDHIEIKYLEEKQKANPQDQSLKEKFNIIRDIFKRKIVA
jgi:hypothetical protein